MQTTRAKDRLPATESAALLPYRQSENSCSKSCSWPNDKGARWPARRESRGLVSLRKVYLRFRSCQRYMHAHNKTLTGSCCCTQCFLGHRDCSDEKGCGDAAARSRLDDRHRKPAFGGRTPCAQSQTACVPCRPVRVRLQHPCPPC
jgi:hypothetical protein